MEFSSTIDAKDVSTYSKSIEISPLTNKVKREVTQTESMDSSSSLLKQNFSDIADRIYANFGSSIREKEAVTMPRSYSTDLIFQSTLLSSTSKEETSSSESKEHIQSDKKSIFRPRQDTPDPQAEADTNIVIHNQITDYKDQSFECAKHTYPSEVVITPSKDSINQNTPHDFTKHEDIVLFNQGSDLSSCNDSQLNSSKERRMSIDSLRTCNNHDYYEILCFYREAFVDFSFLLPGLKTHVVELIQSEIHRGECTSRSISKNDIKIAKRRVISAVCAFGGHKNPNGLLSILKRSSKENHESKSQIKLHYKEQLQLRFFENETRLSWDKEEYPPVENLLHAKDDDQRSKQRLKQSLFTLENEVSNILTTEKEVNSNVNEDRKKSSNESTKAKYRCKLCGQPKQNHTCPYQHSLERSIGTMSYPAINCFECTEPGILAAPLSKMNNFFDLYDDDDDESGASMNEISVSNDQTYSETFIRSLTAKKRKIAIKSSFTESQRDKYSKDVLILPKAELRQEQYRIVSGKRKFSSYGSYMYPPLPLTSVQKRCMSDSLFNLSKSRFGLMEECASVLEDAKKNPESWDLAVAELLTQVLVALYCPIGDTKLDGLRHYLLSFGISC